MASKQKNICLYDKIMRELDKILSEKRISYAQFAPKVGWQTVAFYNRYKVYCFQLEDMQRFLVVAKCLQPNTITCIKCGKRILPKAKSVRRAFCDECRQEIAESKINDSLRYRYPSWVSTIKDEQIRLLVEQEFHIDEITAYEMSLARTLTQAKMLRAQKWDSPFGNISSSLAGISSLLTNIH